MEEEPGIFTEAQIMAAIKEANEEQAKVVEEYKKLYPLKS